jgi:hypothetical protein
MTWNCRHINNAVTKPIIRAMAGLRFQQRSFGGIILSETGKERGNMNLPCHGGRIRLQVPKSPDTLTRCNCSVCHRYGALLGNFRMDERSAPRTMCYFDGAEIGQFLEGSES